ncbi:hypothetical protein ACHAXT_005661 [Thalassiosira profunda]
MPSPGSDGSGAGGVTDGLDPESSRSSFFECHNDDGDDSGGWDALEAAFTQHEQSLSQQQGDVEEEEEEEEDEYEEEEEDPAKRLFEEDKGDRKPSAKPPEDECMGDTPASNEFDCSYPSDDEELSNMVLDANYYSSKKQPAVGVCLSGNASTVNDTGELPENGADTKKASANDPKKRQHNMFEVVASKKKSRRSSGGMITLSQHFSSVKKEKTSEPLNNASGKKLESGMVTIRRGIEDVSFKKGDVWLPRGALGGKGFAFTLGDIKTVGTHHVAEIAAAWMKVENAFLGPEEGAGVKSYLGSEWVLVKKHELLPQRTKLKDLAKRITENLPDEATALCYEKRGRMSHAFYYDCKAARVHPGQSERPRALDLFAGAGGTSLGLSRTGFNVKWKVEMNQTAANTLQMNFPGAHVFCEDIAKFLESCKTGRVVIYPKSGDIVYIHGSPPCQGFSGVNTSGGANDRQNNECTMKFLEAIEYFQPQLVSMENVPGMGREKNINYLLRIVGGLLRMGYQVRTDVVNASHFGDPQNRARVIVLASKKGYQLPNLTPTHGEGKLPVSSIERPGLLPIVTAGDVLRDLVYVEPVPSPGLVALPNGGHVWDHIREGTELREKCDNDYVLDPNLPANTIRKGNQIRHYKHQRYLSVRERARLQSFPDTVRFAGTKSQMFDQIGNAVPVGLAKAIGRAVMESYRLGRCSMP